MSWRQEALFFSVGEIIRLLGYSAVLWGFFRLRWGEAFSHSGFLSQLAVSLGVFWDNGWAVWVLAGYAGILLFVIALYLFDRDELARKREELDKNCEARAVARADELAARFIAEKKGEIEFEQQAQERYQAYLVQRHEKLEMEQKKVDAWKAELRRLRDKDELWKGQRQAIRGRIQTAIHVLEETPPNVRAALRHLKKIDKESGRERKGR